MIQLYFAFDFRVIENDIGCVIVHYEIYLRELDLFNFLKVSERVHGK